MIHQFKDYYSAGARTLYCDLQSDLAPSISKVCLQIYNRQDSQWYDADEENTVGANTDFVLTFDIEDTTKYRDENNVICCRVYQLAN